MIAFDRPGAEIRRLLRPIPVSAVFLDNPMGRLASHRLHVVGAGLKKGQIVLAGSLTRPVDIAAGDVIQVDDYLLGAIGV